MANSAFTRSMPAMNILNAVSESSRRSTAMPGASGLTPVDGSAPWTVAMIANERRTSSDRMGFLARDPDGTSDGRSVQDCSTARAGEVAVAIRS